MYEYGEGLTQVPTSRTKRNIEVRNSIDRTMNTYPYIHGIITTDFVPE